MHSRQSALVENTGGKPSIFSHNMHIYVCATVHVANNNSRQMPVTKAHLFDNVHISVAKNILFFIALQDKICGLKELDTGSLSIVHNICPKQQASVTLNV